MKQLNHEQIVQAADELSESIKNWKLFEHRGEFLVFRLPESGTNQSSAKIGETMPFWRFDARHAAERFRNRKIVAEIATFAFAAAATS